MDQEIAVEVAMFQLRPGTERARFLATAQEVNAVLRRTPGFISRELLEREDGEWLDLIHWASLADAQRSVELVIQDPEAQPFLECIDLENVRLLHYRSVAIGA
jgi:antibiotic biosynthesis monooxygenase (ABM) superfamily enzyme